jgi:hypothetical protein
LHGESKEWRTVRRNDWARIRDGSWLDLGLEMKEGREEESG